MHSSARAACQGDWKLLLHAGSGGNGYGSGKKQGRFAGTIEQKSFATGERQLYNMRNDPDETVNLAEQHPEIVRQLTTLAAAYVMDGRSTPGPQQTYVSEDWTQLDWLPNE